MKKNIALFIIAILLSGFFAGCSGAKNTEAPASSAPTQSEKEAVAASDPTQAETEETTAASEPVNINIGALKGPTAMGMVKVMRDADADEIPGYQYNFTIAAAIDEISPGLIQGKFDIAAIPANLSSVLFNNTEGEVQVLAINTLGVLYIVESGDSVQNIEDLRGKTIYASGKGSVPEFALTYVLSENGIDPEKDVTIEWKSEPTECVAAITTNENGIALLPQPFVTTAQTKSENIRIALDLTKEWDTIQETTDAKSTLITGVIVARKAFIEENPEAVSVFLDHYAESVDFVNTNVTEGAALIGEYDIVPAPIAEKALSYCNITFIEGEQMQTLLSGYLQVLFDRNPQAVGGAMPSDDFYYKR